MGASRRRGAWPWSCGGKRGFHILTFYMKDSSPAATLSLHKAFIPTFQSTRIYRETPVPPTRQRFHQRLQTGGPCALWTHTPALLVPHNVFSFQWLSLHKIEIFRNKHLFSLLVLKIRMLDTLKAISAQMQSAGCEHQLQPSPPLMRHMLQDAQPARPPRHGQCRLLPRGVPVSRGCHGWQVKCRLPSSI